MVTMTHSRPLRASARYAVVLLASVGLVACGSGSSEGSKGNAAGTTAGPSTSSTTATTATPCPMIPTATEQQTPASTDVIYMTDLTTAVTHCGDVVTFTFRSTPHPTVPGYDVKYASPPFRDSGEGRVHDVAGTAFLVVRFDRAAIVDFTNTSAPKTYNGPTSIHPSGLAHVRDIEMLDATEGVLSWVIGLDAQQGFRVDTTTTAGAVTLTIG